MNLKKAKKIRKMISHLSEDRCITYINSGIAKRFIWQQDNSVREEEVPVKTARRNIKHYMYNQMKKHANNPEILNEFIKGLTRALEAQQQEEGDNNV